MIFLSQTGGVIRGLAVASLSLTMLSVAAAQQDSVLANGAKPDDWVASVARLRSAIETEESRGGPPTEEVGRQRLALGRLYEQQAEYDLAAEQFDLALEIVRLHNGFSSLDQVPVLREIMLNAENRGDFDFVQRLEERLVALAGANAGDRRSVEIYKEIADREVAAFLRFREQGTPFNVNVNERVRATYKVNPLFDERGMALSELARGRTNYMRATDLIRGGGLGSRAELAALETRLVRTYYLEATLKGAMPPEVAYRLGEQSYERVLADEAAGSDSARSQALTLVALADWHLLFDHHRPAHERYRQAYDLLAAEPDTDAAELLTEIFAPEVPVRLPAFDTASSSTPSARAGNGDLEVVIEVDEWGHAEAKQITADGGQVPRDLEKAIERRFARGRFRPKVVNGEIAPNALFSVHYPIDAGRVPADDG